MLHFRISNLAARPALSEAARYGLALASVAAALGLSLLLVHYHLPRLFGAFSFAAIAISFWYAGTGPGILAVSLSVIAFSSLLFPVTEVRGPGWESFLAVYAICGVLVGWFSASRRRAERLLSEARDNLERRVAERTRELAQANEELHSDITERKRAERALRESEERFRIMANAAPVMIWMSAPDALCTFFNQPWLDFTGRPMQEQIGTGWADSVHPDDLTRCMDTYLKAFKARANFEMEYRLRRADGDYRWILDAGTPRFEPQAGFAGYIGSCYDVTERKRAEEALRRSEDRLRLIIDTIPIMAWSVRPDGTVDFLNQRWLDYSGLSLEQYVQEPTRPIHPDDIPRVMETWRAVMAVGEPYELEMRLRRADGEYRWFLVRTVPLRDDRGNIVKWYGTSVDIEDRKRAEEALRQSQARFRSFFELPLIGNAITSPEKGLIAINDRICDLLGYSPQELTQISWVTLTHPDDLAADLTQFNRVLAGEIDGYSLDKRFIRKDGETIWARIAVRCMRKPEGTVDYICANMEDITEPRRAEESLRESEERFRTTFENAGIGMALVDMQGHPVKSNPALQKMLGYSEKELSSMVFTEFTHPDDRDLEMSLYGELAAGKRDKYNIEKSYITKDGGVRWGLLSVSLIRDIDGAPAYAVGMVEDITERKRATDELHRSLDQLRALAARVQKVREEERTWVAREIHDELGSGLTAIKIDLSSLVHDLPPDKRQESASILKEIDETIQAVRRLSTELRPGILDTLGLVAAIEWAAEEFQARTGIKCRLELPQDGITIDPERTIALFRIFQETLTNVARHAEATELCVRMAEANSSLLLEVHDNGKGIDEDQLCSGRSLGILGMRERALLLGGDLTITGAPGQGTTVTVRIPEAPSIPPEEST